MPPPHDVLSLLPLTSITAGAAGFVASVIPVLLAAGLLSSDMASRHHLQRVNYLLLALFALGGEVAALSAVALGRSENGAADDPVLVGPGAALAWLGLYAAGAIVALEITSRLFPAFDASTDVRRVRRAADLLALGVDVDLVTRTSGLRRAVVETLASAYGLRSGERPRPAATAAALIALGRPGLHGPGILDDAIAAVTGIDRRAVKEMRKQRRAPAVDRMAAPTRSPVRWWRAVAVGVFIMAVVARGNSTSRRQIER